MRRRHWLAIGAGAAAAVAGAGAAWWRGREEADPLDVWNLRFPKPGGGEMLLSRWRGKPLLLNFWATWCPPCIEEMPLLARFQREHGSKGWQVVGLAVDREQPVQEFVTDKKIDFPIALLGNDGIALSRAMGNTAGGLPFSVVYGRRGELLAQKVGALSEAILTGWTKLPT